MNPIQSVSAAPPSLPDLFPAQGAGPSGGPSFADYLLDSIRQVGAMQHDADTAVEQLFTGGEISPAEVLTAVQKADVAFKMMIQVRNKLVQAFEEVQAMRV
jgi:flagellar hook-basal body complex protein FliE